MNTCDKESHRTRQDEVKKTKSQPKLHAVILRYFFKRLMSVDILCTKQLLQLIIPLYV